MSWYDDGGARQLRRASALDAFRASEGIPDEVLLEEQIMRMEAPSGSTRAEMMGIPPGMSDGDKLRLIADWFDSVYPVWRESVRGEAPDPGDTEVQSALRRMAERLDRYDSFERPLRERRS